jgi:3-dehydrosphinganine reductase
LSLPKSLRSLTLNLTLTYLSSPSTLILFLASQAALHGYTAYAGSKWALRGLAEALQMELKPFNVYVSVSYPPDTNTPGYQVEMLDKPAITKALCETSTLCSGSSPRYSTLP